MTTASGTASSAERPVAFDAIGPSQFTPPDKVDGKNENFEEFAFKLKEHVFLMDFHLSYEFLNGRCRSRAG